MTEDGPAPPALGVKVNVASTLTLPATRSEAATLNVTGLVEKPIAPLDTAGLDAVGSLSVLTVTESVASLAGPMVQPTSVTVTAISAASGVPVAAKTIEVSPGNPGVRTLSAVDTLAVGAAEVVEKKPGG